MNNKSMLLAILLLTISSTLSPHTKLNSCNVLNNLDLNWENGSILIYERNNPVDEVVISKDYELIINGDTIETNYRQKELLHKYHELAFDLRRQAKRIGKKGAKLGAIAGVYAAKEVLEAMELIFLNDPSEETSSDIRTKRKIKRLSSKIENMGDELEDVADDLEKTHRKLKRRVPELNELGWF